MSIGSAMTGSTGTELSVAERQSPKSPGRASGGRPADERNHPVKVGLLIPGWALEGTYRSVGHALADAAHSHRQFVEPNPFKRLWREMALWPA